MFGFSSRSLCPDLPDPALDLDGDTGAVGMLKTENKDDTLLIDLKGLAPAICCQSLCLFVLLIVIHAVRQAVSSFGNTYCDIRRRDCYSLRGISWLRVCINSQAQTCPWPNWWL